MAAFLNQPGLTRRGLAYPAGFAPGFDPSHPAAGPKARFSGIALGGNFVSLFRGNSGSTSGTLIAGIDGRIGPLTKFTGTGPSSTFSGQSAVNETSWTIGAIFISNGPGSDVYFCTSSAAGGGQVYLNTNVTTTFGITASGGGGSATSGIAAVSGVPYFVAGSVNSSASNFVVKRLDTGQIFTAQSSGITTATPNGTYMVGSRAALDNNSCAKGLAAVMATAQFCSLQQLLIWAADHCSFWYPFNTPSILTALGAAAASNTPFFPWIQ